jgi:RNA recognition motif-containing protein
VCAATAPDEKETRMSIRLYVANLPYSVTDEQLAVLFARYGEVTIARVATEPGGRRSRGFGWVYMTDEAEARTAMASLSGTTIGDRTLRVNEARSQG